MHIGDKVSFVPSAFINSDAQEGHAKYKQDYPVTVTGTIFGVHRGHRWYRVRFAVHGITMYECFKFGGDGA